MIKELTMEKTSLPYGWELKTIADVTKIVAGGTPKTSIKEYWDGDIAWITPADLGKLKTTYLNHNLFLNKCQRDTCYIPITIQYARYIKVKKHIYCVALHGCRVR